MWAIDSSVFNFSQPLTWPFTWLLLLSFSWYEKFQSFVWPPWTHKFWLLTHVITEQTKQLERSSCWRKRGCYSAAEGDCAASCSSPANSHFSHKYHSISYLCGMSGAAWNRPWFPSNLVNVWVCPRLKYLWDNCWEFVHLCGFCSTPISLMKTQEHHSLRRH